MVSTKSTFAVNRAKMLMDRVIARRIGRDPSIVDRARAALQADVTRVDAPEWWALEWLNILEQSPAEVRRFVTSRSTQARRLSDCSPFYDDAVVGFPISDIAWRRRVIKKASSPLKAL